MVPLMLCSHVIVISSTVHMNNSVTGWKNNIIIDLAMPKSGASKE